jgi:hypothetical protein
MGLFLGLNSKNYSRAEQRKSSSENPTSQSEATIQSGSAQGKLTRRRGLNKLQSQLNRKSAVVNRSSQTMLARFRILAALLLASIAWASTVEFTHHHGLRNTESAGASEVANQANNQNGEAQVQDSNSPLSSSRSNPGAECSICQLHHNLATTLLSEHAAAAANETRAAHLQSSARVHFLEFTATLRGRAPPVNL